MARTHRHTGRKGLFLSSAALGLTGITPAEGQALLPFLLPHASSPNYAVDFGWKTGGFVIWDNQAHLALRGSRRRRPRAYRKVIGG